VPNYDKFGDTELEVMYYEFKAGLNKYLAGRGPDCSVRTMEDVIRFNEAHQALVMPYFGQEHMQAARSKGSLKSKKYRAALAKNTGLAGKQGLTAAMTRHRLGALVVPSGGPAWVVDLANGDAHTWDMESTSVPAVAGTPHVTVPAGHIFGLPVGISFLGQAWAEPQLIQYAYAFEQATRARKPPQFLPQVRFDSAA
jgi:amidase